MLLRKNLSFFTLIFTLSLFLTACGGSDEPKSTVNESADASGSPVSSSAASSDAADDSVTVTDMTGREVSVPSDLERAVVLSPSECEILYAIGAGDIIVGRTQYCDYPEEALDIDVVSSGDETNVEEIIALDPQVVFMSTMAQTEDQISQLEDAGISVIVSENGTIDDIYTDIEIVGKATGHEEEASSVISKMQDEISEYSDMAKEALSDSDEAPKIYFEVSPLEYGLWTAGSGTYMDEAASLLGAKNIFSDVESWAEVSEEQVIEQNPDYIVTTSTEDNAVDEILSREGWEDVSAVKNAKVLALTSEELTRPGPRVADGVKAVYEFIYGTN